MSLPEGLLLGQHSPLLAALETLARDARCVFLTGLPGMGKSLLIHQLAHLGHARGRRIDLLQWDVARPPFEAGTAGRRYAQRDGITHPLIRIAVGRWVRPTLARWDAAEPRDALLIGEAPFIGHRFIELARPATDAAEPVLTAATTRFVLPIPSLALRRHLEDERARRARAPVHPREREDAPPDVMRAAWHEVREVARALGIPDGDAEYDPATYRAVYERLLAHRHVDALAIDERLPADRVSPYELRVPTRDVVPSADDADRFIAETERDYADSAVLERAIARWFSV